MDHLEGRLLSVVAREPVAMVAARPAKLVPKHSKLVLVLLLVRKAVAAEQMNCVRRVLLHVVKHVVARHESICVHLHKECAALVVDDEVGREEQEAPEVGSLLQQQSMVGQGLFAREQTDESDDALNLQGRNVATVRINDGTPNGASRQLTCGTTTRFQNSAVSKMGCLNFTLR